MLDAKLLMYLPFLDVMASNKSNGGVFFTASDDIETFNVSPEALGDISREWAEFCSDKDDVPVMASLGHPSTLQVGTGT